MAWKKLKELSEERKTKKRFQTVFLKNIFDTLSLFVTKTYFGISKPIYSFGAYLINPQVFMDRTPALKWVSLEDLPISA
jgi:hypothetical protein